MEVTNFNMYTATDEEWKAMSEHRSKFLAATRSWVQQTRNNGSSVTWGSGEVLNPPVTVRDIEELAEGLAGIAAAPATEPSEVERLAVKAECVAFFRWWCRWWWNQSGLNTEQGYDQWVSEGKPGVVRVKGEKP